jgi:hypothetical protein
VRHFEKSSRFSAVGVRIHATQAYRTAEKRSNAVARADPIGQGQGMSQPTDTKPASPEVKERLEAIIRKGLVQGIGDPTPGHCCVMAAINLSLGNPHGDEAPCVHPTDRALLIEMNDLFRGSHLERAELMLPIALRSLDTAGKDRSVWVKHVEEQTVRRILPKVLRKVGLSEEADRCEIEGSKESARAAVVLASLLSRRATNYADADAAAAAAAAADYYAAAAAAADYYAAAAAAAAAVTSAAKVIGPGAWATFQQIILEAYELETEK